MTSNTTDFLSRLRDRIEAEEKENKERLDKVRRRTHADHSGDVIQRPAWLKNAPARNHRRASLLGLLRGEITTQSSTHRNQKNT